ncbi:MAG TPA: MerR family transcriptional regulator [Mycobacteriales bacterium]|nr:MerR family transcriptional regulator [Mycobacteriales bacterium]
MDDVGLWTLDQLTERVAAALSVDYDGAPTGRVRDIPDRRSIRWYATIGLVDRPAAMRGRTALYGDRHLAQIVAIKRRQADGRTLAEIQAELAGAPEELLREIARVTADGRANAAPGGAPVRARFWADAVPRRGAEAQVTAAPGPASDAVPEPVLGREPVPDPTPGALPEPAPEPVLAGVRLVPGVTLLLDRTPRPADLAAIRAAAGPLLDLLAARGLRTDQHRTDEGEPS